MHWTGVRELNEAGKITAHRDYWDTNRSRRDLLLEYMT
jgi:hypothetical protein